MIYVKFGTDNKSTEMKTSVTEEEKGDYVAVSNDSFFGKRLIKTKTKVREFTQNEYATEASEGDARNKAVVIDNMARVALRDSEVYALPDFYESLSDENKAAVRAYRDFFRHIKAQDGYPLSVVFPEPLDLI